MKGKWTDKKKMLMLEMIIASMIGAMLFYGAIGFGVMSTTLGAAPTFIFFATLATSIFISMFVFQILHSVKKITGCKICC